jgi:hypothetical protein
MPVKLWSHYRWENNTVEAEKFPQFQNDPELTVAEVRAITAHMEGEGDREEFDLYYASVPPVACAVLLRDYADRLRAEDISFCADVIMKVASFPNIANYTYQIGDGVQAAIQALPQVMRRFPVHHDAAARSLLYSLFNEYPVGLSGHVFDFAINAIAQLRVGEPSSANNLLHAYLEFQQRFEEGSENLRLEAHRRGSFKLFHSDRVGRLQAENAAAIDAAISKSVDFETFPDIGHLSIEALTIAFQLLPTRLELESEKSFTRQLAARVALGGRRRRRSEGEEIEYEALDRFLRKFASVVLAADAADARSYVEPFVTRFRSLEFSDHLLQALVSAEEKVHQYETFWIVWEEFYPCIVEVCKSGAARNESTTIHNYLLAWPWWKKDAKEWLSLKAREMGFLERVCLEIGNHPAVLDSIAKLLNEIGSSFAEDGILWIGDILTKHTALRDAELETNTVYYLENLTRKFGVFNRDRVRSNARLRTALLTIVNFLIDRGSVTAYLTREFVL